MRSQHQHAFTLIELLVVIVVIGLLAALLLPAIGSAVRRANEAAVQAEQNMLIQALTAFKAQNGDYPPSRILICENGDYGLASGTTASYGYTGANDISDQDLARRSVAFFRRAFPRLTFSTVPGVAVFNPPYVNGWMDCNGSGGSAPDPPYVLTGDECLCFFLGGIPQATVAPNGTTTWTMTGFSTNRNNPFTLTGKNRTPPSFEFKGGRLVDLDKDGMPSYLDSLGTGKVYAYFSAYGNGNYDPQDVNFPEDDSTGTVNPITLKFRVSFPVGGSTTNITTSPAPNPYTTTLTTASPVGWQKPNSFQLLAAGVDGLYGLGGYYAENSADPLPVDATNSTPSNDTLLRKRESDNLTSFKGGRLD